MGPTLEVLGRGPITLDDALEEEANIINLHSYGPDTDKLYQELWDKRLSIAALTRHHLGLGRRATCTVLPRESWLRGAFNVCVFVEVGDANGLSKKVVFRCPMPHKLAEKRYPGSIDEKLSCEVGAHIWVEENCPEIRSPHLFGFGFLDGRQVSIPDSPSHGCCSG